MNFSTKEQILDEAEVILDQCDAENRAMTKQEEIKYDNLVKRAELKIACGPDGTRRVPPTDGNVGSNGVYAGMSTPITQGSTRAIERNLILPAGHLKAFSNDRAGRESAYASGQWLRATLLGNPDAANWCNKHSVGVQSAMAGGSATAGGVLVPEELSTTIINLTEQYGLFRRSARVMPMSSDTLNVPRKTGGLTAYYVGEGVAGTESDTVWDNVGLVAKKLMVLTRISSEINTDAVISIADMLAQEIALAFAYQEDLAGFTGDGTSTYGGTTGVLVKAIDGNHALAVVEAGSGIDTLPEITATDCINLMAAIPTYAKAGSAWYCSPTAEAVVFDAIKIAGGGNTASNIAQAGVPRFMGYPINSSDVLPDSVSTNYNDEVMLAFGNLAQAATMGARRDIRIALSDQQYWEEDQLGIKGTERYDINVHDLGSATVKSPFAVLIGTT